MGGMVAIGAPTAGFHLQENTAHMISTNAVTEGDIVVVDENTFDTTARQTWDTVKQPVTAELEGGVFGVALEDIAAGAVGHIGFVGRFLCLTNGAIAHLEDLGPVNAQDYLDQTGAAAKIIAKPITEGTSVLILCQFDGINGFGNDNA